MALPRRLINEALELPSDEREELLRALLDGLDEPGEDADEIIADGRGALRQLRAEVLGP